jgi:signal recognition particle subunit SRP54
VFDFLSQKFSGILGWLKDKGRITEENLSEAITQVEHALLEADVPYEVITSFLSKVKEDLLGEKVNTKVGAGNYVIKVVHDRLLEFLGGKNVVTPAFAIPSVIMVMGLQGSGKTTSISKIAHWLKNQAKKKGKERRILFSSVDFYRPAAIDQLKVLSEQVGADFFQADSSDPVRAASMAYDEFKRKGYEYLFLDTAGRLHVDNTMMEELRSIEAKVKPRYKMLVLDAMTGQESLEVAKAFEQVVGFDGALLSKMDSEARGGAAFAFRYLLKKPIWFVGSGESSDDLEMFIPGRVATRMLGMGDIVTLVEKASEKIDASKQESMARRLMSGNFTLEDFADQMNMMNKLGPLQKVMKYIPGMGKISPEMMDKAQGEMKFFKAIISSMTQQERVMPRLLDASRKKRIAKGSGTSVQYINQLLQKFEQSKQFGKMFKKMNGKGFF